MAIDGNDLRTNLGEALQFRGRVIFVFLLPVNIVVKVVKMRILIFVIYLYAIVTNHKYGDNDKELS